LIGAVVGALFYPNKRLTGIVETKGLERIGTLASSLKWHLINSKDTSDPYGGDLLKNLGGKKKDPENKREILGKNVREWTNQRELGGGEDSKST